MIDKSPRNRGFTLIEMLVVVGIIVVVTGTVLANNSKFGGTVLLQNLAYDIALSTREAQVYGMSVLKFQSSFTAPFGVHFDTTGNNNKMYIIFADAVGASNGHYDTGELVNSTSITRGFYISQVCVTPSAGAEDCTNPIVDIIYNHPDPDAAIRACSSSSSCQSTIYQRARIVVMSPRGDSMNICVDFSGQISVHTGTSCTY